MGMPEGLQVNNCSVKYPGVETKALQRLSFELPRGSFFVLSGASGSGKTTLLKSIAGLTDLEKGEIRWKSVRIKGPSDALVPGYPQIKLVTQELELQEKMTVLENLKHALRAFSEPYKTDRIGELIAVCKLAGLENRLPVQLSGGQRQRVVWATMLADEPELLLLDEPFSHLDMTLRSEMAFLLKEIQEELNVTMLLVTHDPLEALSLGEKIILLRNGTIEMFDTPENIYRKPVSVYAASFFGEVNIFTAKELERLQLKKEDTASGKWLLRPEFVRVTDNDKGIGATVAECQFKGFFYLVKMKTAGGTLLKAVVNHPLEKGAKQRVILPEANLHQLSD